MRPPFVIAAMTPGAVPPDRASDRHRHESRVQSGVRTGFPNRFPLVQLKAINLHQGTASHGVDSALFSRQERGIDLDVAQSEHNAAPQTGRQESRRERHDGNTQTSTHRGDRR
jgi:hypothetical protein